MQKLGKIALAVAAGVAAVSWYSKRKNNSGKGEIFTAPDGNTYRKDQLYKTADGKLYKNGNAVHYETPDTSKNGDVTKNYSFDDPKLKNNYSVEHEVAYHQRGKRHR